MYQHIWVKYLPVIRILMKRSASGDQSLDLNKSDFEKGGVIRKAGYKFTIVFSRGRVSNVISSSTLAPDLAAVLLQDPAIKGLIAENNYEIDLNTRFQLAIRYTGKQE
ncbi:MAG: hypothetical protein KGO82_04105 [Bacteroidota bacterium]|nr:hypothetical protein [Bacteroidota bacterium]